MIGKRFDVRVAAVLLMAAAGGLPLPLSAQLFDPTRPPQSREAGDESREERATGQEGSRVRAVLVTPRRRLAAVDGQWVAEGEEVAGATVVRISWGEVVLRSGSDETSLRLTPLASPIRVVVKRQPLVAPVAVSGGGLERASALAPSTAK